MPPADNADVSMLEPSASDRSARRTALDPARSFIVQAPAGSGKTELLIQRYLKLLTTVAEPEQIVAITFTRKAAGEMRSRVLRALRAAAAPAETRPAQHAETLALATAALDADRARSWSLLAQPQRLRIDTLDALNATLAQHLPVLSGGVAGARILEDAGPQYHRAARRTLDELEADGETAQALRSLLPVLDNAVARAEQLLAGLLPKRDQWLRHLVGGDDAALRGRLESGLAQLVQDRLARLRRAWPEDTVPDLLRVLQHAAAHAERERMRAGLVAWKALEALPANGPQALAAWRGAARLLLTAQGRWRQRVGKREGCGAGQGTAKERLQSLLAQLAGRNDLAAALAEIGTLPEPQYDDAQWRDLTALRRVLLHLVAELRVVFAEERAVDFVELGIAARAALGSVDQPSDLLLALDRRIRHLMVDEFQDTSHAQVRLLEQLTSGWEAGDGRSVFLVGDPMQSIYRFRDADVALFARARKRGIGQIRCTPLTLISNYRSRPAIVEWVNAAFGSTFAAPAATDGVVYQPCRAMRGDAAGARVHVHAVTGGGEDAEIATVIDVVERARGAAANGSLAILVQSRSHLFGLHEKLLAGGWPVHAVELEAVADQQIGQDLIGLTRALTHVGDRVAWLGVLRAPWCGLTWDDLERLCAGNADRSVWALLNGPAQLGRLSPDGQRRAARLRDIVRGAFGRRGRDGFSRWVELTWQQLDGPACIERTAEHAAARHYFRRLDELAAGGDLTDPAALEGAFAHAAGQGEAPQGSGIEIMTIHRAKGLEFDTVVLFGLGKEPRRDDASLLHWLERRRVDGEDDLLLAPPGREDDRLAAYLRRLDRDADDAERARLLYVAMTRAKEQLHLIARHDVGDDKPRARSLLSLLWPRVAADFAAAAPPPAPAAGEGIAPRLRRLREVGEPGPDVPLSGPEAPPAPAFEWVGQTAVQVGALVHRYLERFAAEGLAAWDTTHLTQAAPRMRAELELLGVEPAELDSAVARVSQILGRVLEDPRGRWVLAAHTEAEAELRLTVATDGALEHLRLDRTFVADDGLRWIIDYKTSRHEGGNVEAFLDAEVERYRAQLERYAAAMREIDPRPIRVGLYFPLLGAFRSWTPDDGMADPHPEDSDR